MHLTTHLQVGHPGGLCDLRADNARLDHQPHHHLQWHPLVLHPLHISELTTNSTGRTRLGHISSAIPTNISIMNSKDLISHSQAGLDDNKHKFKKLHI